MTHAPETCTILLVAVFSNILRDVCHIITVKAVTVDEV